MDKIPNQNYLSNAGYKGRAFYVFINFMFPFRKTEKKEEKQIRLPLFLISIQILFSYRNIKILI